MTQTPSNEILRLDNQLCFALYAASRTMMNTYRVLLAELGLTFPQYLVMLVLWEMGTSTVKDLGHILCLDSGTLSPMLKRLDLAHLITRTRSLQDERTVEICLTESGRALQNEALSVAREFTRCTNLNAEEFVQLRDQLRDLAVTLMVIEDKDQ